MLNTLSVVMPLLPNKKTVKHKFKKEQRSMLKNLLLMKKLLLKPFLKQKLNTLSMFQLKLKLPLLSVSVV